MNKQGKLELTWVGKYDYKRIEPRILIEDPVNGYGTFDIDNLLIHGDNLIALKALESEYYEKVKCIYIDPPYNTGSAFEHYDDNLEHSIWLSFMRDRLVELKKLLAPNGSIVVQIGFDEMAYLKVLMDEIFGRDKCFGQVAVRMSHSAGMKRKAADKRLIKNTEYILFYYKDELPDIKPIYEVSYEYPVNYYQFITKLPHGDSPGKYTNLIDIIYKRFEQEFVKYGLRKNNEAIKFLFTNSEDVHDFIMDNKDNVVRKDSNAPRVSINQELNDDEFIEYISADNTYYIGVNSSGNVYQIYSLADKVKQIEQIDDDGNITKVDAITNLLGDWWDNFYKDMSRVDIEGNVKMKTSKKPERLIYRILDLLTNPGDLVLDSFLGSGTTAAVAHKMKRKWIGIEYGEHCYSLSKKRLDNVIDGDSTGISKLVNWSGGGGYRFYELAPSLLVKNSHLPIYQINPDYDFEMMCKAICKIEGFKYKPNGIMHGYSSENRFIHVTEEFVNADYIKTILSFITEKQSVVIYTKTIQSDLIVPENITIKIYPKDLISKCEFESEVR